jgi:hypothetical protein
MKTTTDDAQITFHFEREVVDVPDYATGVMRKEGGEVTLTIGRKTLSFHPLEFEPTQSLSYINRWNWIRTNPNQAALARMIKERTSHIARLARDGDMLAARAAVRELEESLP